MGLTTGLLLAPFIWVVLKSNLIVCLEWHIAPMGVSSCEIILLIDSFALYFFFTVVWISLSVLVFRLDYMKYDLFFNRFHLILILFIFSIISLIFSPNLIRIFLGWDGLGVTSYLLVVYYNNRGSLNAGILTFLVNRLGDAFLLRRLGAILFLGNYSFFIFRTQFFSWVWVFPLFILASCTKSAQVPFRAWLPAAIAAPTPVSALVHSSTLVTAGIYVLIRFMISVKTGLMAPIIEGLFCIGLFTTYKASLSAIIDLDIKKIVALSTLRQLGIIIISISIGQYWIRFAHLIAHANYKALWFINTGGVIHNSNRYQSFFKRSMSGGTANDSIITTILAVMALSGAPFIGAFYTKEPLVLIIISQPWGVVGEIVFTGGVALTVLYRFRFIVFLLSLNQSETFQKLNLDWRGRAARIILEGQAVVRGYLLVNSFSPKRHFFFDSRHIEILIVFTLTQFFLFRVGAIILMNYISCTQLWGLNIGWLFLFYENLFRGSRFKNYIFNFSSLSPTIVDTFRLKILRLSKGTNYKSINAYKFESIIIYQIFASGLIIVILFTILK